MTYIPDFAERNFVFLLKKTVVYIQQHETYKSDNKTWSSFPLFLFLTLLIGRREIEREDDIKKKKEKKKREGDQNVQNVLFTYLLMNIELAGYGLLINLLINL